MINKLKELQYQIQKFMSFPLLAILILGIIVIVFGKEPNISVEKNNFSNARTIEEIMHDKIIPIENAGWDHEFKSSITPGESN